MGVFRNSLAAGAEDISSWDILGGVQMRIFLRAIITHFTFFDNVTHHTPNQYNVESLLVTGSAVIRALPYPGTRIEDPPHIANLAVGAGDGLGVGLFVPINQRIEYTDLSFSNAGLRIALDIANNSANDIYYRAQALIEIEELQTFFER